MSYRAEPQQGEFYKHFKGKLYQIVTVAKHSETMEKLVIYQALYGDFKTYARPLEMFLSEVDKVKYPEVSALYRFEKYTFETEDKKEDLKELSKEDKKDLVQKELITMFNKEESILPIIKEQKNNLLEQELDQVNPLLLEFLEMETYEDKLALVLYNKSNLTDDLINGMAASIDCTVEEGELDSRINSFFFCLQTLSRFESKRLR